jgi:hypothetical protein
MSKLPANDSPPPELPELPHRRHWPKYTPEQQALILDFLGGHAADALEAWKQSKQIADLDPTQIQAKGTVEYWDKVLSAVRWLASKVPQRQRHLAVAMVRKARGEV